MLSVSRRYLIVETNMYNPASDTFMATQIVFTFLKEGAITSNFFV